jgi:hypothetical protein
MCSGYHHVKQDKSDPKRQTLHVFSHIQNTGLKNQNVKWGLWEENQWKVGGRKDMVIHG